MAKITREPQKIFGGSLSAADNIAVFGSTKAGTPTYSLDPSVLQSTAFLSGWAEALVNNKAPTVQELNGVFYVSTYQLAYLMQTGVPEYDAAQVYYIGSLVNNGSGAVYKALTNGESGNALTLPAKWLPAILPDVVEPALVAGTPVSCTFQDTGDTVTSVGHGLPLYSTVVFSSINTTTGIAIFTRYYVINPTADTFKLSATASGTTAIELTTDGTGAYYPNGMNTFTCDCQLGKAFKMTSTSITCNVVITNTVELTEYTIYVGQPLTTNCVFRDAGDIVEVTGHKLCNLDVVRFTSIISTTGISTSTNYYVRNATADTFQLSTDTASAILTLTTDGIGIIRGSPLSGVSVSLRDRESNYIAAGKFSATDTNNQNPGQFLMTCIRYSASLYLYQKFYS